MMPREQLRLHRLDDEQEVALDLQARRVRRPRVQQVEAAGEDAL